jgi:hypothetical protein
MSSSKLYQYHRFLDESGDPTFFGKGDKCIIGENGVSLSFMLGMVKINSDLEPIRKKIIEMQNEVINDILYKDIPSIKKKAEKNRYYFHATDDIAEVRDRFLRFINTLDCSFEVVVARKIPHLFVEKHKKNESYLYADLLSHLLKNKFQKHEKMVLNIASRGKCTKNANLDLALRKAKQRFEQKHPEKELKTKILFSVNEQTNEPLLCIPDYFCWAVQNVFEKGTMRYYNFLKDKISVVIDLYDKQNYGNNWGNYYSPKNPLTEKNKLSPPLH